MKQHTLIRAGVLLATGTLALTACGGGSSGGGSGGATSTAAGDSTAQITVYNTKPQNPLIPGATQENGGLTVIEPIYRGLVQFVPGSSEPQMAMAESITSTDNKVWDIKLKAGNTFQDGTPVDADSFINAWNWSAYAPNGALNNYYFEGITGYADLNPPAPAGSDKPPTPKVKEMSGLKKVSDTEFMVTLDSPLSIFKIKIGYVGFAPLPPSFFKDPVAYGKKPVGNGPLEFVSGDGDTGFVEKKWDGYKGADAAKVAQVTFKTYTSPESAYSDLVAGNLDFMEQVPPADLVNDQYKTDLPNQNVSSHLGYVSTITVPWYDSRYADPNLTKAISLSLDRAAIAKSIYNNGRTPATGWVSPVVAGYKAGACGQFCTLNPTLAKQYYAKAKFKGPYTFATNFDGPGNKEFADAICNGVHNVLGATCTAKSYVDFGTFRTDVTAKKMTGMFRTSWIMDYPSIENFLQPLYGTTGGANDGHYANKAFDDLIAQGDSTSGDAGLAKFQQAEALLQTDFPVIPMFYVDQQSAWSNKLSNVKINPTGTLNVAEVTATS